MLLEQIKYLHSELCSIQSSFLGVISIPLAVYGLLIYYALQLEGQNQAHMFVLLPFLFSLSLFNILKYTIKMMGLDAYIRYLEQQLNTFHKKSLFKWQSYLIYANSYSVAGGLVQVPIFLALAIFLGCKFFASINSYSIFPNSKVILTALLAFQAVGLLYMLYVCATQYGVVEGWCDKIGMSETPSPRSLRTECPPFARGLYERLLSFLGNH